MELRNDPRKEKATTKILAGESPAERSLDHHTLEKGAAGLVGKPSSRNAGGEESAIRCPSVEYGVPVTLLTCCENHEASYLEQRCHNP